MPEITSAQYVAAFFIQTAIFAFFCWSLYRLLLIIKEPNRDMAPGHVWLLLIPGLALFWNFKVVSSMASSLHKEFTDRNYEIEDKPGFIYGMIYAVLSIAPSILVVISPSLIMVAGILNFAGLIFFAMYWFKMNWYKKVLREDLPEEPERIES